MIRVHHDRLELTPSDTRRDAPRLSLPLLSLHVCPCRTLVKAYAKTEGRLAHLDAYDPEERFEKGAVPGGLIVLRRRHGEPHSPCLASETVFGGPAAAVRLLVDAMWKRPYLDDPLPALPAAVAPSALDGVPGVQRIDDAYRRRPSVYLVDARQAVEEVCGPPDFSHYERWRVGARVAIERFLRDLPLVATPGVEVRTVIRPPRRPPRRPGEGAAVPRPEAEHLQLPSTPAPDPSHGPRYTVQLSLF